MRANWTRLTRRAFYRAGGLANPNLCRKMRGGAWTYWQHDKGARS